MQQVQYKVDRSNCKLLDKNGSIHFEYAKPFYKKRHPQDVFNF
ncbi:hypothetical protein BI355_2055 [Companilactobacillus crustorum]|nr:hypothetical protein BI355_2055 [Companilactobacillus crustorum]